MILITIPFSANDAVQCERLLDFIFRINGKNPVGHVLLVPNADVHAEYRQKIRITAELAFESVLESVAPAQDAKFANSKFHQMNGLFRHAAAIVQQQCRWPWLWLEPDCTPVKPGWIAMLAEAYDSQPKKYLGLMASNAGRSFMARCGIYPVNASYELDKLCQDEVPFALACADEVTKRGAHTDLIQYLNINSVEDIAKINPKAVLVHGDKSGIFAENWSSPEQAVVNAYVDLSDEVKMHTKIPEGFAPQVFEEENRRANPSRLSRRQKRELQNGQKV